MSKKVRLVFECNPKFKCTEMLSSSSGWDRRKWPSGESLSLLLWMMEPDYGKQGWMMNRARNAATIHYC